MADDSDDSPTSEEDYDLCIGCGAALPLEGFPSQYPINRLQNIGSRMKKHLQKYSVNDVVKEVSICARCGEIIIKPKEENLDDDYYEGEFVTLHNTQWVSGIDDEEVDEIRDILRNFDEFEDFEKEGGEITRLFDDG